MVRMLWPSPLRPLTKPFRPLFGPCASSAVGPRNAWHGKPSSRWAASRASSSGKPTRAGRRSWGSSMRWGYPWRIWSLRLTSNAADARADPLPCPVGRGTLGGGPRGATVGPFPDPSHDRSYDPYDQGAAGGPGLRTQPLSRPAGGGCGGDVVAGRAASPRLLVSTPARTSADTCPGGTADASMRDAIGSHPLAPRPNRPMCVNFSRALCNKRGG